MAGALLGDFVKGPLEGRFPARIEAGIRLHRQIDVFTDSSAITLCSRNRFSGRLRRYSGIIVDVMYDHFLATKWSRYGHLELAEFCTMSYETLIGQQQHFEGRARTVMIRMCEQNWLASYVDFGDAIGVLGAVSRRLRHSNPLADCRLQVERAYSGLETDFEQFFPLLAVRGGEMRSSLGPKAGGTDP